LTDQKTRPDGHLNRLEGCCSTAYWILLNCERCQRLLLPCSRRVPFARTVAIGS